MVRLDSGALRASGALGPAGPHGRRSDGRLALGLRELRCELALVLPWERCPGGALRVLPAGTRWEERNKATIRGFRWRQRDADHTATGKRPFPCILRRDRMWMKAAGAMTDAASGFCHGAWQRTGVAAHRSEFLAMWIGAREVAFDDAKSALIIEHCR